MKAQGHLSTSTWINLQMKSQTKNCLYLPVEEVSCNKYSLTETPVYLVLLITVQTITLLRCVIGVGLGVRGGGRIMQPSHKEIPIKRSSSIIVVRFDARGFTRYHGHSYYLTKDISLLTRRQLSLDSIHREVTWIS